MSPLYLLIIVLIVILVAGLPTWGYHRYGGYPSGIVGVILVILILWLLVGHRL